MNCLENLYFEQFQRQGSLTKEQGVGEINPLFALERNTDIQHAGAQMIRST
jgi:hypothetical protein